jgi:integrase
MNPKKDLYNYDKTLDRCIERIKKSDLSPKVKSKIDQFQRDCTAEGVGPARILRYLNDLPKIAKFLGKNFEKATTDDIKRAVREIEKLNLSYASKLELKRTIKRFYKWLNGGEDQPECIRWLKTGEKRSNNKMPEDLLTEEEIKKMIELAFNPRDRALLSLLWESGCRAGEILTMQIKHIAFEDNLTRITVNGKTGPRRVPIIYSTPYLSEWLRNHPFKEDPEAYLWMGIGSVGRNKMLNYAAFRKMIADVAIRAEVKKRVNPHNFRHSRSTYLAKHLTEAQMTQYLGWVMGSDMPATYVHLSGRDMDDAILKLNGERPKVEENVQSSLAPRKCPRCTMLNTATGRFCIRCGAVLDMDTAIKMQDEIKKIDDKFSEVLDDPEVREVILKKIIAMESKKK